MKDVKEELEKILLEIFNYDDVRIISTYKDFDLCFSISWKLNNRDSERPNKRSKKLQLIITVEAIENYSELLIEEKERLKIKELIREKTKSFKPDHDATVWQSTPVEKYVITSRDLLNIFSSSH